MHVHICDTGNWKHDILSPGTLITGMGGVCTLITRSGGGVTPGICQISTTVEPWY